MTFNKRSLVLSVGGLLGAIFVMMGALGAHLLEDVLTADAIESYMTASRYGLLHALLLVVIGLSPQLKNVPVLIPAGFLIGTLLFSGSIYVLSVFGGPSWLGPVTPVGGVTLICSWFYLSFWALFGDCEPGLNE